MPLAVWTTLITAGVGLAGVILTALYAPTLKARRDRADEAARLVRRYRDPLLHAAFELQSRLWNIVSGRFLTTYYLDGDEGRRRYAEESTLWILAQFLGWVEIVRREVQFLELDTSERSGALRDALFLVTDRLATDQRIADRLFMLFKSEQRAIGELMITGRSVDGGGTRSDCIGFAEFSRRLEEDQAFARWFTRIRDEIEEAARAPGDRLRLIWLQRALLELIDLLDPTYQHFPAPVRQPLEAVGLEPARPGRAATV